MAGEYILSGPGNDTLKSRTGLHHLLILGVYSLLALVLTYPVVLHLTDQIAGFPGEDNLQWRWFLWWFKHSLLTLQIPVTDLPLLYAPLETQQPLYAISIFTPAVALPLTLAGGPTLSFNLSFLISFVLTGYTTFLLTYHLTHHRLAGFIAGLIFAFYPARFGYATGTFLGQLTVYFLPLYVLGLWLLIRRATWRRAIWTAIVLACLGLTWPLHVAYGVVVFTLPALLYQAYGWLRWPVSRANFKYLALAFGLALSLIAGFYLPLLLSVLRGENRHLGQGDSVNFALDLLAFVSPSNYHPLLAPLHLLPDYATRVLADRDDIQERLAYLGLLPVLLAGLGLVKFRRRTWGWLVIGLLMMILSLGPLLKFNGELYRFDIEGYVGYIILPYAFLHSAPILNWSETLGRFNVATMLCLAVLAAYGAGYLLGKWPASGWRLGLTGLISLLILLEYVTIFPFPTDPGSVPAFYYKLKQEGETTPQQIIDLPLALDPSHNNTAMHYQTVHQQAMAGGHFIRKPAGAAEMTLFLNQLLSPPLEEPVFAWPEAQTRLALLNRFGFTKVVARPWLMTDPVSQAQLAYLATWLGAPRVEGEVSVFEVPAGETTAPPLAGLLTGAGWQAGETGLQLNAPADLLLYAEGEPSQPIDLQLAVSAGQPDRYLALELDGRPVSRLYLSQETLAYNLPAPALRQAHRLTFRPEETCQQACNPVNFSRLALALAPPEERAPVVFGDRLRLVRQEISSNVLAPGQPLLIYLYWQNQQRLQGDYSAFVHLMDPSGRLVAQADYLLGGWLYPTSRWPAPYLAAAPTLLFVPPEAPPGEYQLLAGLYEAGAGERLWTESEAGRSDTILLQRITVKP